MKPKQEWPWAGWGLSGMFFGFGLAFLFVFPLTAAGGPPYKGLALLAIVLGGGLIGWRFAVLIGYLRNFPS